jgi:hypothetical protein
MMTVVGHGDKLYEFGTLTTFAYPIEGSGMGAMQSTAHRTIIGPPNALELRRVALGAGMRV